MSFAHTPDRAHIGRHAARGFGLTELMVAMALSLLLLGGVVAIFSSSRASYETTDRLSRIQENGRFALDQLVNDIRHAGFVGCARVPSYTSTSLGSPTDIKWNFLGSSIQGFQFVATDSYQPTIVAADRPSAADGSDILLIRRPEPDAQPLRLQSDMGTSTANLAVPNVTTSGLDAGDVAMIYSCEAQAFFQVSTFTGGTITHAAGGSNPGNTSDDLSFAFRTNAEVIPVETVVYYIRASGSGPAGSTSLWRRIGAGTPEELVEGVEQMQLRFGVDTTGDAVVDNYQTADAVTNWNNVYAVEVGLLVRSLDGYGQDRDQEAYQLLDVAVAAANDTRMREVFTATVGIRNRVRVN